MLLERPKIWITARIAKTDLEHESIRQKMRKTSGNVEEQQKGQKGRKQFNNFLCQ